MNKTASILVVDDEPEILRVIALILDSAGYEVWTASTGRDGLQLARQKHPDLILLDVLLPDLNGMELCKQIKDDPVLRDVFVVLISGGATSAAQKVVGLESGADDYMVKPLDPDELLARIRTMVRLKDSMAALRASDEHHRRLIEILPDAVCLMHPEGRLLAVNSQAVKLLGYASPEELLKKNTFDITPAKEHERIRADIAATLQIGMIRNAEYTLLKKNGAPLQVELNATVSFDANARPAGLVIVGHDVTERKQAEQKILQLLDLLDHASDSIIIRNLEGQIQYFNKGAERLLGWTAEEARGHCTTDLFFKDAAEFARAQETLRQTGVWSGEVRAATKTQKPIILHSRWTLVGGRDSESSHVVSISTDITRRKETEEALRQTQERYRRLAESSPDAIFILDEKSTIQYVNQVAAHWLGRSDAELLGHSQSEFFPPEIARQHQAVIQKVFKTGKMARMEGSQPFGAAMEKWIETRLIPLRNQQGTVVHVMGIVRDFTEQKQAEASLREREEWGQKIISTAMDGFWMVDLEGNIVDVNEAYCRMSGYSREELLSLRVSDVEIDEPSPALVIRHVQRIVQAGSDHFETRHRRKDGRIFEIEVSATFVKLREPRVFAFFRDITGRKQTDRALRDSEERFRQLADNIREVFWMSDPEKNEIVYVSPVYEEIWGRTCESLYVSPRDWVEAIHPDDRERVLEAALTKQVSGKYDEEYRIVRPDGLVRWIQDRAFPVQDGSGKVYRIVGIAEDITQRKRAEEAMRKAEARYRSIFENATEGIFRTTPEGRILIANPALARMFGYQSPEEMMSTVTDVGRQLYVSPEKRAEMKRLVIEHGSVQGFEEENRRKDGSIIWVSLNAHVVHDASGAIQYFEGTLQDITERKRVEGLLQTQRDFGTFLSSSIDLSAAATRLLELALQNEGIDCAGVFLVEPETEAMDLVAYGGFSADFAKRASHLSADLGQARTAGRHGTIFSRQAGGPLAGIVHQLKRENLSAMEVLPIQDSGKVVAVLSVGSHVGAEIPIKTRQALELIAAQAAGAITRIRVGRSLRANRRLLERTLHSLPSAVLVLNAGMMVIEECNPAATRMFGYSRDELIGRIINTLHVNRAMAKQFEGRLQAEVEDKGFLTDLEFKMKHKNGTVFPTGHSMMPIRNEAGQLVNWVSVIQDITEHKRAEHELRQLHRRIIEAQETERLRVARELHDGVNQVIASVKMRLRKLESGGGRLNPADREILTRCDKLLVQALEENSRIAYNLRPSDLDELGLAAACRNFCEEIQGRTDLTIKCNITPIKQRLPPALELNLFRILQEALANVETHAHAEAVQVRLSFQDHSVVLKIQDDGRGFAARRPKVGGGKWRGLGLTNMRERALSLGGTCEVVSAPGAGTTISVRIPCKRGG